MVNTKNKMKKTNSAIIKALSNLGFHDLYSFPHGRFQKDYNLYGEGFDAFGWNSREPKIYFFQYKSNKKPSKKTLNTYRLIEKEKHVKCWWINKVDYKGIWAYSPDFIDGIKLK